jgi:hypothetical protein
MEPSGRYPLSARMRWPSSDKVNRRISMPSYKTVFSEIELRDLVAIYLRYGVNL